MGILDDAIREHLELKRRHGVPEDELQRQEEEALGPARREAAQQPEQVEPAPGQTATAEAERDPDGPPADDGAPAEPLADETPAPDETAPSEETVLFDMQASHETVVAEPEPEPETEPEPEPPAPERDSDAALGDTQPHGFDAVEDDDEQSSEDADDLLASDQEDEEDLDLLEDTPDFLQETPEHDRLWFEQKPPRDFDFD